MPYRIELIEQGSDRICLVWEIGDIVVVRERLEDAPALATYIAHLLRLSADPQDIRQCAEQAVRGRSAPLRVRLMGNPASGPNPQTEAELARLRARNQQLEQQATRNRDGIAGLKQENDQLARQAAAAAARATQAAQAERAAREAATQQVAAAQKHTEALQAQLARADNNARMALQEVGTLRNRLREAEDELTLLRRRLAGQTHDTEGRRLT